MKSFLFKGRYIIICALALAVLAGVLVGLGVFEPEGDVIAKGVSVSGVDLGGMTKAEAKTALDGYANFTKDVVLNFQCEDVSFATGSADINLGVNTLASADRAYAVGRSKDAKKNKEDTQKAKKSGINLNMVLTFDKDKFLLIAGDYLGNKTIDPSPMTVEYGEDCLIVTNAMEGKVINTDTLLLAMEQELSDFKWDAPAVIKLENYTPENLTFDEFKKQYVREAQDAVYTNADGNHNIEPEVVGVEIDEEEAKKIFEENKDSKEPYKIPAKITRPQITAKYLEDKYVNKIMAQYSTSFAGSSEGRCQNIILAASKIDGYVLNPGEKFSYNAVVGPRTEAAGFKIAHVYVGTKVVDGIGGGICQVSSALYNAVVMADLKTVTRVNHSIPVNYVPMGRDATVSYGSIDYVFQNDKSHPVSIKATVEGTTLTVSIVGTSEMDYTVEFQTKYISSIPYSEIVTEDETLPEGESKVIANGSNGSVYESYRVYKRDGVEFDRKFESKSRYQPTPKEVAVGTKKADDPVEEPVPPEEETNELPPLEENVEEEEIPLPEDEEIGGDVEDIIVHPEVNINEEIKE